MFSLRNKRKLSLNYPQFPPLIGAPQYMLPEQDAFGNTVQCSAEAAFLRHCRTNFENGAAKTVPVGHLAHIDICPVAGL